MSQDRQQQTAAAAAAAAKDMTRSKKIDDNDDDCVKQQQKQRQVTSKSSATKQHGSSSQDKATTSMMKTNQQTKLVANLHSAANEGKVELVRLLIRCGADVNAQDEQFGNTALHQAAWNGFSETVQVLCKYRANTSIKNKAQFTPLHMACQQGHNQTARLLLMANAKTEAKNSYGDTPLHTAARYGHAGVVRILLSAKCNPNQTNKNNDTPLHIAAAMGRRKLTKIFMQNGAEPIIKNKQNETAMDIALRKDLIDIQELIANPPPTRQSTTKRNASNQQLSQLEQRYGQLYAAAAIGTGKTAAAAAAQNSGSSAKHNYHQRSHQRARRHAHLSSGDEDNDDDHHLDQSHLNEDHLDSGDLSISELEARFGRVALHGHAHKSYQRRLMHSSSSRIKPMAGVLRGHEELAVDVPAGSDRHRHNHHQKRLVTRNGFSSVHSLSAATGVPGGSITTDLQQQRRRFRTKTIGGANSGADLHLLPNLLQSRSQHSHLLRGGGGNKEATKVSSSVDLNQSVQSGEACPPDARDNPNEWADIMAKSAQYRSLANSPTQLPVINPLPPAKKTTTATLSNKKTSPAGSVRSSLSKSRGRLIVRRRKQKPSLLVRRPNLGTCVGKLSLLRLRSMVNKRTGEQGEDDDDDNEEEEEIEEVDDDQNDKDQDKLVLDRQQQEAEHDDVSATTKGAKLVNKATGAIGRRQERLERMRTDQNKSVLGLRAPNGTQLLSTRPLASLNDDTQLYAIPKKSKTKQQVVTNNNTKDTCEQQQHQRHERTSPVNKSAEVKVAATTLDCNGLQATERVPSGGPALTSDGGRSSAGSSSSFARATPPSSSSPIASTPDECVESLDIVCVNMQRLNNVGQQQQQPSELSTTTPGQRPAVVGVHVDRDLYAPGYSIIRERPIEKSNSKKDDEVEDDDESATEPCLCERAPYVGDTNKELLTADNEPTGKGNNSSERDTNMKLGRRLSSSQLSAGASNSGNSSRSEGQQEQVVAKSGESKTSKLRQLLHLESRNKDRANKLPNGQARAQPTTTTTTGGGDETTTTTDCDTSEANTGAKLAAGGGNGNQQRLPMSAIAGGYYAYSPVVQSSSELKQTTIVDTTKAAKRQIPDSEKSVGKSGPRKSWLMSKFSLSSSNIHHSSNQSQVRQVDSTPGVTVESGRDKLAPSAANNLLVGPERKAELITINGGDLHNCGRASVRAHLSDTINDEEDTLSGPSRIIRPKSAMSTTNAELIAAQKSLAAAAAAKVNRNRLVKMSTAPCDDIESAADSFATSKESVLTVKTSGDPFWHHHHGQPLVVANGTGGQKYMMTIGQSLAQHRSGTNSVGMSDSSPSNNGAESDNSIQTTTGSMNTDNTSGGQPAHTSEQNSSSLGILSRILLNNKSIGYNSQSQQQNGHSQNGAKQTEDVADTSGSTLRNGSQTGNGSLGSSSTLSSPAPSNSNNQTTGCLPAQAQKLDQLSSRSRCPIVMTRSNDLPADTAGERAASDTNDTQPPVAPRLPSKSALKFTGSRPMFSARTTTADTVLLESMNGLPRVSSYTRISPVDSHRLPPRPVSTAANSYKQQPPLPLPSDGLSRAAQQQQSLCNYHAMNRNLLVQTQYSPYLPYSLGRYSIHESCEPSLSHHGKLEYPQAAPMRHHLSHHDLRSIQQQQQQQHLPDTSQSIDLTLPATAVNYEYYLDTAPNAASAAAYSNHHHHNHLSSHPARYHYTATTANDNSIYPNYPHDDSIYIPYMNASQIRDTTSLAALQATGGVGGSAGATHTSDLISSNSSKQTASHLTFSHLNHHQQHHFIHQQQRPKSSLDNFLLSNSGNSVVPSTNGRRLTSATQSGGNSNIANGVNNNQTDMQQQSHRLQPPLIQPSSSHLNLSCSQDSYSNSSQPPKQTVMPSTAYYTASAATSYSSPYYHNGAYLYPSENSIYASDQSTAGFHQRSDLTVLPTTTTATVTPTTTDSPYRPSSSQAKALTEGGENESSTVQVNSSSSSARSANPTPRATARQQQQEQSSWTPTPYKSLVQVNLSSPAKSNQSCQADEMANSEDHHLGNNKHEDSTLDINNVNGILPATNGHAAQTRVLINSSSNNKRQPLEGKPNTTIGESANDCSAKSQVVPDECNGSTVL